MGRAATMIRRHGSQCFLKLERSHIPKRMHSLLPSSTCVRKTTSSSQSSNVAAEVRKNSDFTIEQNRMFENLISAGRNPQTPGEPNCDLKISNSSLAQPDRGRPQQPKQQFEVRKWKQASTRRLPIHIHRDHDHDKRISLSCPRGLCVARARSGSRGNAPWQQHHSTTTTTHTGRRPGESSVFGVPSMLSDL